MIDNTKIQTTKEIYPQIYAYTLPTIPEKDGWIKIGYTTRQDVDERIKEQVHTAAIRLQYEKLWAEPAKFSQENKYFTDHQLHAYLTKFKEVKREPNSEWFYYNGTPEKAYMDFNDFRNYDYNQEKDTTDYALRKEQKDAVEKTINYFKENPKSEFLWNAKPRFGKTLTTYDLIRQMDFRSVLIVTNRPAIANSWFDDFEKFISWQSDFLFVSTSESLKDRKTLSRDEFIDIAQKDEKAKLISFVSLQDLKGSISFGGNYKKLKWVKDTKWDLLVIDEAHEGVDTLKTDVAFRNIQRNHTLHLSGTPFKQLGSGQFSEEQIYNWTYSDEQKAKTEWDSGLEQNNPYIKLPKLNMFSYQMSAMITDEVNQGAQLDGTNIDYAFDLNEFFETNETGKFVHEKDILKWLDTLTRNEKYPFSTKELRQELKHTFWLLNRVDSARALKKLLNNHPVFEQYEVVLAAGDGKSFDDEDKKNEKSFNRVKKAIEMHDKTITLSVGQLTTGVTIPEWTAVLMLSNMQSSSLYMQAAFRAQNPWEYEVNGEVRRKENAYVFDFAPERTLMIYDEFANNLAISTANGNGTTEERRENIRELLNFFPVIAEDTDGKMIPLDVDKVLTIPKSIKAKEVVKRGFMSNLLFQNISGIFASPGAKEILEQMNPSETGESMPNHKKSEINLKNVQVDEEGNAVADTEIVIAKTNAHFGTKVYTDMVESLEALTSTNDEATKNKTTSELSKVIENTIQETTQEVAKAIAQEVGLSTKVAEQIVKKQAVEIAQEVRVIEENHRIKQNELIAEMNQEKKKFAHQPEKIEEIIQSYEVKRKEANEQFKETVKQTVEEKTKEIPQQTTQQIIQRAEEKKKDTVEDDIRARLRGFTRTIPSFLMAYGEETTTLGTFDVTIKDDVFKDVTGISLEQFRILRDTYQFFDPIIFDESVQEFLRKREELANYFDESQEEDIFDYIPPQKTNQIFTPKNVVKMMVDKLEEENPSIFKDSSKTFADLYMKSGLYITEIVKRLFKGLESEIPNENDRLKHILENQVYGFAPTEIIYNIARNFIFGFDKDAKQFNDSHIVHLDTTPYAMGQGNFEEKCDELFGGKEK